MSFFKEFKDFAMKGNVIDLAVGIIIGAAFNAIVNSLVENMIMPVIGLLTNGANFTDRFVLLNNSKGDNFASLAAAKAAGAPVFAYGAFIQACFQFLIIAFSVFLLVKLLNSLHRKKAEEPAAPAAPSAEEQLLIEIRDAIKAK